MMEIVEEQVEEIESERKALRKEIALIIGTLIFAGAVTVFIAEPSMASGMAVCCSLAGYAAVSIWACFMDRPRCTKRYG